MIHTSNYNSSELENILMKMISCRSPKWWLHQQLAVTVSHTDWTMCLGVKWGGLNIVTAASDAGKAAPSVCSQVSWHSLSCQRQGVTAEQRAVFQHDRVIMEVVLPIQVCELTIAHPLQNVTSGKWFGHWKQKRENKNPQVLHFL